MRTGLAGSKRVYGNSSQYVRVYRAHGMSMMSRNTAKSLSDIWKQFYMHSMRGLESMKEVEIPHNTESTKIRKNIKFKSCSPECVLSNEDTDFRFLFFFQFCKKA